MAGMGEGGGAHRVLWGNERERDHLEDLNLYGRIIRCITMDLKKRGLGRELDYTGSKQEKEAGCYKSGSEILSYKMREIF